MSGEFSNEDLTAYLDGEADADLSRAIEDAVAQDPALADRLAQLHLDADQLRQAFDGMLAGAPAMPDLQSVPTAKPSRPWLGIAAAAVICAGVGFAAGQWQKPVPDGWQDYAAAYHRLYVPDTLNASVFSPTELGAQLQRVGAAVETSFADPIYAQTPQVTLKRAQILGYETASIAHLAYTTSDDVPIALCVTKRSSITADTQVHMRKGVQSLSWVTDGHEFLLLGDVSQERLLAIAAGFGAPNA